MNPSWVVITGPSRGIGRATALALAKRGCSCALLGRPSKALEETLVSCREATSHQGSSTEHLLVECDLANPESIESAAARVLETCVPAALINNAGVAERALLEALSLDSYRRQLDTNLLGPLWLTRALLRPMRAQATGRIVNVASISATLGTAGQIAYNASKWALVGFTKSLAEELHDSGLSAVAVLPGAVDTEMLVGSGFAPRITPEAVAQTLVHYALDAPLAHNGAVIEMFGT